MEYLRLNSVLYLPLEFTSSEPGVNEPVTIKIEADTGQQVFSSSALITYPVASPVTLTVAVGEAPDVRATLTSAGIQIAASRTGVALWKVELDATQETISFGMLTTNIPPTSANRIPGPGCSMSRNFELLPSWSLAYGETL